MNKAYAGTADTVSLSSVTQFLIRIYDNAATVVEISQRIVFVLVVYCFVFYKCVLSMRN